MKSSEEECCSEIEANLSCLSVKNDSRNHDSIIITKYELFKSKTWQIKKQHLFLELLFQFEAVGSDMTAMWNVEISMLDPNLEYE